MLQRGDSIRQLKHYNGPVISLTFEGNRSANYFSAGNKVYLYMDRFIFVGDWLIYSRKENTFSFLLKAD